MQVAATIHKGAVAAACAASYMPQPQATHLLLHHHPHCRHQSHGGLWGLVIIDHHLHGQAGLGGRHHLLLPGGGAHAAALTSMAGCCGSIRKSMGSKLSMGLMMGKPGRKTGSNCSNCCSGTTSGTAAAAAAGSVTACREGRGERGARGPCGKSLWSKQHTWGLDWAIVAAGAVVSCKKHSLSQPG